MNEIPGINLLPEKWRGPAMLAVLLFPYLTRAYYALANGGGIVGGIRAVLWGTNSPKAKNENNP
jgi:hypothetical protein